MLKRFDQAKPFLILGIVVVAWLIVPTAIKRLMRATFFEFQAPVDMVTSSVRDVQTFWSLRTRSNKELMEAGQQLARLNSAYEVSIQQNASMRAELTRLEELLRLPSYTEYRSEPARVVRRDFNGWWQRIVIRKGRNAEIPKGAPVVFVGGVVGRVVEVYAYESVVDLISTPGIRLSASLEGDTRSMSYQGASQPVIGPAKGVVEFVPLEVFASHGSPKQLVTSGLGGIFPPGLNLGRIVKLEPSADGLFKTGEVELDPRLGSLTEVTVLVPLKIEPTQDTKP